MYLPGNLAPEIKVFSCRTTKLWLLSLGYDFDAHRAELGEDHHLWPGLISSCLHMEVSRIVQEACDRFAEDVDQPQLKILVDEIKVAKVKRNP